MLKHLVFFNMKEKEKAENTDKLLAMLRALPASIPQIAALECGRNIKEGPAAYDVALYTAFANEADLDIYREHPEHVKVLEFITKVTSQRSFVDYLTH